MRDRRQHGLQMRIAKMRIERNQSRVAAFHQPDHHRYRVGDRIDTSRLVAPNRLSDHLEAPRRAEYERRRHQPASGPDPHAATAVDVGSLLRGNFVQ